MEGDDQGRGRTKENQISFANSECLSALEGEAEAYATTAAHGVVDMRVVIAVAVAVAVRVPAPYQPEELSVMYRAERRASKAMNESDKRKRRGGADEMREAICCVARV